MTNTEVSSQNGLATGEGCFWCGGPLSKRQRKYCSAYHRDEYYTAFMWGMARDECLRRSIRYVHLSWYPDAWQPAGEKRWTNWPGAREAVIKYGGGWIELRQCAGCLKLFLGGGRFEVHHKEPMNGEDRSWSAKNRQSNLEAVCHDCHWGPDRHGHRIAPKEQMQLI